jgi:hypothetical protein
MLGCNYAILYNERASDKILGLRGIHDFHIRDTSF